MSGDVDAGAPAETPPGDADGPEDGDGSDDGPGPDDADGGDHGGTGGTDRAGGADRPDDGDGATPAGAADDVGATEDATSRLSALFSAARAGRFVSVGVVGAVADNAVLAALGLGLGVPDLAAKAAGVETAVVVMFLLNERWTFADAGAPGPVAFARRLLTSHLVRSGGVAVQLAVYWLLVEWLSVRLVVAGTDLWFLAASPVAIAVAMSVNYVFESLFTWGVHR